MELIILKYNNTFERTNLRTPSNVYTILNMVKKAFSL